MSDDRPRFVVKWVRKPPALYMLVKRVWEGQRRVETAVWVRAAEDATGFLTPEDAFGWFDRICGSQARADYDVRPMLEEIASKKPAEALAR